MATNIRDPRTIITPDAFEVSEALLGTPLAPPWRRLQALLIDMVVIGLLTVVTASISLILWGGVALFLISMAFRRPPNGLGQVATVLFRGATGCLGSLILVGVLIGYLAVRAGDDDGPPSPPLPQIDLGPDLVASGGGTGVAEVLRGLTDLARLSQVEDTAEAARIAADILRTATSAGISQSDARTLLDEAAPSPAWSAARDAVYARAFERAGIGPSAAEAPADAAPEALIAEIAALPLADAAERFAALRADTAEGGLEPAARDTLLALRARLLTDVARDTLEVLSERIDDLADEVDDTSADLRAARARLDAGEGGFRGLLRDIWEQLGSAIGLWSVYFTVALTVSGGRTVGKKLRGIRVLRLDGEPLNWWTSFERAGGYVAGIATGTLGFAQVFWDPNRQCVHDKIVSTVVVIDGAAIEPGAWQEAWQVQKQDTPPTAPSA